jgi:hypothetical protein
MTLLIFSLPMAIAHLLLKPQLQTRKRSLRLPVIRAVNWAKFALLSFI